MELNHKCNGCRYQSEHQEMGFRPFGVCTKETDLVKATMNYNAECCPYIVEAYNKDSSEELQNVFADLTGKKTKDFEKAVEAIKRLNQAIMENLTPILDEVMKSLKKYHDSIFHCYPNKKVVHLAMHHKKERVKKKNRRRIMRWLKENHDGT